MSFLPVWHDVWKQCSSHVFEIHVVFSLIFPINPLIADSPRRSFIYIEETLPAPQCTIVPVSTFKALNQIINQIRLHEKSLNSCSKRRRTHTKFAKVMFHCQSRLWPKQIQIFLFQHAGWCVNPYKIFYIKFNKSKRKYLTI